MGGERLIELDEAQRIEVELSAELPTDPEHATAIVKRRLTSGGADLQRRIASAYQGITDAWSLGVTSLPAEIGRASCRERVFQSESITGVAVALKNKNGH